MQDWIITGWYKGCEYVASGGQDSAVVPDWLWGWLRLDTGENRGILKLMPAGRALLVGDLAAMRAEDVVSVLETMTDVAQVSGDLPPRRVTLTFADTSIVQ